jgi:hypothetical protein
MISRGVAFAVGAAILTCAASSASALQADTPPNAGPPAAASSTPAASTPAQPNALKHLRAGTAVVIELAETVSSGSSQPGAAFSLRLAEPVVVDGAIVLPAGLTGKGEVIDARAGGVGGAPGKLVLAARSLTYGEHKIPLRALRLSGSGQGHAGDALTAEILGGGRNAGGASGAAGMKIRGDEIVMPPGTRANAEIGEDLDLPALAPAPASPPAASVSGGSDAVPPAQGQAVAAAGRVPPPPPGKGEIVFYRQFSWMGAALSYNLYEGDAKLGHLGNGHYRIVVAEPGKHTYNMHSHYGDTLTLEVEPGEIYYVRQGFGAGYGAGNPVLEPSDEADFNRIAAKLKPEG